MLKILILLIKILGYWVKVQKLAGVVQTSDYIDVELYVDKENVDISSLKTQISSKKASEISSLTYTNVSNVVLSKTVNGQKYSSASVDPKSNFATNLTSMLSNINDSKIASDLATTGSSLYVYSISEGGSPSIIADAEVYSVETNGSVGNLIGSTSSTGFLYLTTIPTSKKVYIAKAKYESTVQTISAGGSANYIFISEDDGTGIISFNAEAQASATGRVLNSLNDDEDKILEATIEKTYMSSAGGIYLPAGGMEITGSFLKLKSADWSALPDYNNITTKLEQVGYIIYPLGKMIISSKTQATNNQYNFNQSWNDVVSYTGEYAGKTADIETILGISLTSDMIAEVSNEDGNVTQALLDKLCEGNTSFGSIELYYYNNNEWKQIRNDENGSFSLRMNGVSALSSGEKEIVRESNSKVNTFISTKYVTGPKPIYAFYKKAVNQTPDLKPNEYTLNVKVIEAGSKLALNRSAVKLKRGNGGVEILKNVDSNGTATFTLLSAQGSVEDFTISAIEGEHYPISKTLNISSLNQIVNGKSSTDITMEMMTPPEHATVKCEVKDENSFTVANANVQLIAPIALATVNQDVKRIINDVEKTGIEVGGIVGAKYSWFVKKHKDDLSSSAVTPQSPRTLQRISEDRWILIKEGTLASNGNFLSYDQIVALAMRSPLAGDPEDVKIVASGQFDIAVQVEHDINRDQKVDFSEVATDIADKDNLDKNFTVSPDRKYPSIGYIATKIDLAKMYEEATSEFSDPVKSFAIKTNELNNGQWLKINGFNTEAENTSIFNTLDNLKITHYNALNDELSADEISTSMKIIGNKTVKYLRANYGTVFNPEDYTTNYVDWGFIVITAVKLADDSSINLAVAPNGQGGFKWVKINGDGSTANTNLDQENIPELISVQKSDNTKLFIDKIAQIVSSNKFLEKLAMPLSEVLTEANVSKTAKSPNKNVFDDGFTLDMIPTLSLTVKENNQNFFLRGRGQMSFKSSGEGSNKTFKDYIVIDRVVSSKPVYTPAIQYDVTDRVGLCQFSPVEMDFSQFKSDESISLLRIQASKLGYFDSSSINVPSFKIDDVKTAEREDIKRVDLSIKSKPTYTLTVKVVDAETNNPISDAVVSVDGIKTAQNLEESQSIAKIQGSTAVFSNVIGGGSSNRIVRVEVPNQTTTSYIASIKTVNNFSANREITIKLVNSNEEPTRKASTTISDYKVDMEKGNTKVFIETFDKLSGNNTSDVKALTSSAVITPYVNSKEVKFKKSSTVDGDSTKYEFELPLEIGVNEVYFEVANQLGISRSSSTFVKYDPNIGHIKGSILDANLSGYEGSIILVDVYNSDNLYINTATAYVKDSKVEYVLENLKAKETYKLVALQLDKDGKLRGYSDKIPVTVPSAQTAQVDMTIIMLQGESAVSGAPLFDTVGNLPTLVNNANGVFELNATVSNFDLKLLDINHSARLFYITNDDLYEINTSSNFVTKQSEHSYIIQNYPIKLHKGVNNFYLMAINPNYAYDWTRDYQIKWLPAGETPNSLTVNLNGCEENGKECSALTDYYVSLYTDSYQLLSTKMTNSQGQAEFTDLVSGTYIIYPDFDLKDEFKLKAMSVPVNKTGSVDVNLSRFDASSIAVPDFSLYGINEIQNGNSYSLSADLSPVDGNYSYEWFDYYLDENSSGVQNRFSTEANVTFESNVSGNHEITLTVKDNETNATQTFLKEIYIEDASNRILPRAPEVPNL